MSGPKQVLPENTDSAWSLVHRLLTEQALGQWKRYAIAFTLMGVAAGATGIAGVGLMLVISGMALLVEGCGVQGGGATGAGEQGGQRLGALPGRDVHTSHTGRE